MQKFDLDLDALEPEAKKVKLGGQIIEVYPSRFKNLVRIIELTRKYKGLNEKESVERISEFRDAILDIVPALKDDKIDLSISQLMILIQFIIDTGTPKNIDKLKEAGYEVKEIDKKKIEQIS